MRAPTRITPHLRADWIDTLMEAPLAQLPDALDYVFVADRNSMFRRADAEPPHDLKFENDGAWFGYGDRQIIAQDWGAGDPSADDGALLSRLFAAAAYLRIPCVNLGDIYVAETVYMPDNLIFENRGKILVKGSDITTPVLVSSNHSDSATAVKARNITLLGLKMEDLEPSGLPGRPFVVIQNGDGFVMRDFDLKKSSAFWTVLLEASNARISDGKIDSSAVGDNLNGDGIHIVGGENIIIERADIYSEDDSVALFPHNWSNFLNIGKIGNVRVRNCRLRSRNWSSFKQGAYADVPSSFGFGVVAVEDCDTPDAIVLDDERPSASAAEKLRLARLTGEGVYQHPDAGRDAAIDRLEIDHCAFTSVSMDRKYARELYVSGGSVVASPSNTGGFAVAALYAVDKCAVNNVMFDTGNTVGEGVRLIGSNVELTNSVVKSAAAWTSLRLPEASTSFLCHGNKFSGPNRGLQAQDGGTVISYSGNIFTGYSQSQLIDGWAGGHCAISGAGAPSATVTVPDGSIYSRLDAAANNLYVRQGGAWVAK